MSGVTGPKKQFFSYVIDLPSVPVTTYVIEWQDSDGVNQINSYSTGKFPITVFLSCVIYGTFIINGSRFFAIDDPCPGNNICARTNLITNNGKC
jgi:hypothetical protein